MICIGDKKVKKCLLGDEQIKKVYFGDDLVYDYRSFRLPEGYTEVEYIERTGKNLYLLGAGGISITKKYYLRVMPTYYLTTSSYNQYLFSGTYKYTPSPDGFGTTYTDGIQCFIYPKSDYIATTVRRLSESKKSFTVNGASNYLNKEIEITIDLLNKKAIIGENEGPLDYTFTSEFYSKPTPYVFGDNSTNNNLRGRLYSYKEYDNDNLIADYVPCVDPSGTVGAYDIVRGIFVTPTGAFTAGPAV